MKKMEIERRFLLKKIPDTSCMEKSLIKQIYTEYISRDGSIILTKNELNLGSFDIFQKRGILRLREINDEKIEINVKIPKGKYRKEFEAEIPFTRDLSFLISSDERKIEKIRYNSTLKNYILFIDVFKGRHKGIIIEEIEFISFADMQSYTPDCEMREILLKHRLSNKNMYFTDVKEIFKRITNI